MAENTSELKRGTLEMVLLKLIAEKPMYGYELIATLEARGGEQFQLKEGTLYPVLYRLENAGYITPYWETAARGVPRKYYRLTQDGQRQLETLVSDWRLFSAVVDQLLTPEQPK